MVTLYNAERELLRQLAGPVVLLVSSATEKAIRQQAPDFFTWAARSYEAPAPRELVALAKQLGVAPAIAEPPEPVEEPIRFLHISDIHLRPHIVKRYDQDRVLRGLVDFLERDRASFPLDLVFVTGDLANTGKAEEYVLVVELLKKLMDITGVPPAHMFVVPGNHDVDREVGRWLLRTLGKDEEAIAFFEDAKSRAFHLKKLEAYAESMRALLGDQRPLGLAVGEEAVELVEVRGARVAVASFNSAWFAQGDDDRGKLWLGEPNVNQAGQRAADLDAPFAVALMHHPFDELHESERDDVEHYVERSFDLVVRGHLHKDKTREIATQRGGYVELAGPAAYQGSQWPNGCFLGEIRPKTRKVRLRPYAYASPADGWVLDTKVFPDDEKDGYCHTFAVAEKRRTKSSVTKQLEKATEQAVRTASSAQQRKIAERLDAVEDVAELVKMARARAGESEFVQEILTPEALGQALGRAVVSDLPKQDGISRDDPDFLEKALNRAAPALRRVLREGDLRQSGSERATAWAIQVALRTVFDRPVVAVNPLLPNGLRPDILIGSLGEPAERLAVIEVKHFRMRSMTQGGLAQLDKLLAASHAAHGALVLFDAYPPMDTGLQIEHVKTPAGRDVLLVLVRL
jgi:predicted MPP superfamily phosphohydrolase